MFLFEFVHVKIMFLRIVHVKKHSGFRAEKYYSNMGCMTVCQWVLSSFGLPSIFEGYRKKV